MKRPPRVMRNSTAVAINRMTTTIEVPTRPDFTRLCAERGTRLRGVMAEHGVDVLVLLQEPTFPGCHIEARPIGVLDMRDEKGPDHKILAVPLGDPRFQTVVDLSTIDPHWLREIENFFQTYKTLEDKWTEVVGWEDGDAAEKYVRAARERYARGAV